MNLTRVLSSAVAIACFATLVAISLQETGDGAASPPPDTKLTASIDASMKAEQHWSFAQTSMSRSKVSLSASRQGSFSLPVRIVLAVLLIVSTIFAYNSDLPHMAEAPTIIVEQPRRLANALLQALPFDILNSNSTKIAASHTVDRLRLRGLRHRLARIDQGEDGMFDDDRDSAKLNGYMSRAKEYAQRQQFEKATEFYKKAIHMAEGMLKDFEQDKTGAIQVDDAQRQLTDVVMQTAAFYLERGQSDHAQKVLESASATFEERTDAVGLQCRMLTANAFRDAGKLSDAVADYKELLETIASEAVEASPLETAMLDGMAAEIRGEHARALLSEGLYADARKLLDETLDKLALSSVKVNQGSPTMLTARLKGLLAFAHLKQGNPKTAVDLLDESLAGFGNLPSGLAGATPEIQELLQNRAMAKAALGDLHGAADDLDVVQGVQDELKKTISDEHNPEYMEGEGKVPDPRLWASMSRTKSIAAEIKILANASDEAMPLAKQARQFLREVKKGYGQLPKGYNLATFAEIKQLIAKLRGEKSVVVSDEASDDDAPWVPASWVEPSQKAA